MVLALGKNRYNIFLVLWIIWCLSFPINAEARGMVTSVTTETMKQMRASSSCVVTIKVTPEADSVEEGKSIRIYYEASFVGTGTGTETVETNSIATLLGGASEEDYKLVLKKDYWEMIATPNDGYDPNESIKLSFGSKILEGGCVLSTETPTEMTIAIVNKDPKPLAKLSASFEVLQAKVEKGLGSVEIARVSFSVPAGQHINSNCRAVSRVNVIPGGSAKSGVDFNFTPTQIRFESGDSSPKTQNIRLDVLSGTVGDGDKTVKLEAIFSSNESCSLDTKRQRRTIIESRKITVTLKDPSILPVVTPVSSIPSSPTIPVEEGEKVNIDYEITGDTSVCESINPVVIADKTTANPTQYRFDKNINLLDQPNVSVEILKQDPLEEKVLTLGSVGIGCELKTKTTTSIKIPKKRISNPEVNPDTKTKQEPEDLKVLTCTELSLKDKQKLTPDDKSFFNSNCKADDNTRNFEPEEVSTQTSAVIGAAGRQLGNIRSRLTRLRMTRGQRKVDVSGATLNIQGASISVGLLGGAAGDDKNSLLENSRWGFFANGDYSFGNEDRGNDSAQKGGDRNFDFNSTGLTFGTDYRFPNEKMIIGTAIGYKDFSSDYTTQAGGTDVKGYNLSIYGTYLLSDKAYMDATIGLGKNRLDSRRPVNNDGENGIGNKTTFAIGKPDAKELVFSVGGGYEFYKGEWSLSPYGRMDYTKGTIDAYTESPSHSSARTSMFQIDKQNIEALTSILGIKASRVISTSKGVFSPYASLEWKHDFKERGSISGSSVYLNKKFEEGDRSQFDKNYYNLGVGISAQFPKGKSAFLSLESRQGDFAIEDNTIRAGFRMEF